MAELACSAPVICHNQRPIADTDSTMITFMNDKYVRRWNLNTGQLIWQRKIDVKRAPTLQNGNPPMILDDERGALYVPHDKMVYAFSVANGENVWAKDREKFRGRIQQVELSNNRLFIKGGPTLPPRGGKPFIACVDAATGKKIWQKKYAEWDHATSFVLNDENLAFFTDQSLTTFSAMDGHETVLADEVEFSSLDIPFWLSIYNDSYILEGAYNIVAFNRQGRQLYHWGKDDRDHGFWHEVLESFGVVSSYLLAMGGPVYYPPIESPDSPQPAITPAHWLDQAIQPRDCAYQWADVMCKSEPRSQMRTALVKVDLVSGENRAAVFIDDAKYLLATSEPDSFLYVARESGRLVCYPF
jgi:hypothetical protein